MNQGRYDPGLDFNKLIELHLAICGEPFFAAVRTI